jgi:c-di-GMP-binding flagellar brake protein YcgR
VSAGDRGLLSIGIAVELQVQVDAVDRLFQGIVHRVAGTEVWIIVPHQCRGLRASVGAMVRVEAVEQGQVVRFECTLASAANEDAGFVVQVTKPSHIRRDRRQYFRLPHRMEIRCRWADARRGDEEVVDTDDISGGGIGLVMGYAPALGRRGTAYLPLDQDSELHAAVSVVRVLPVALSDPTIYRVGLTFVDPPVAFRDGVIAFIFEEQRARRRRALY